jgi:protein O-mannosyl-transferase
VTPARRLRLYEALIVLVGAAVFWNSLRGPFLFDDVASIPGNATIRSLWPPPGALAPPSHSESVAGRPLVNLSLAINYAIGGLDVRGYHVGNITIHIACALLLFGLVRRTLASAPLQERFGGHAEGLALVSALVWMVHPLHSEPVDYVVARTESLMAFFFLLTVYCSVRADWGSRGSRGSSGAWRVGAVVACAAGMACKETMAAAPLAVMLYDWTFSRDAFGRRRPFYVALLATWAILAAFVLSGPRLHSAGVMAGDAYGTSAWTYLVNQTVMIVRYLRLLIWPRGLVLDYGYPRPLGLHDVWPAALLVAILLVSTLVASRRWPPIGFAGAWFFLVLAPSSSFVPIVTEVGAERRVYLASMPLVACGVAAAWLVARRLIERPILRSRLPGWMAAAAIALLASATIVRNREYQSPLTMWRTVIARWPNGRAYSNLATELQAAGYTREVIPTLRQAVRDFPDAEYDLGAQLVQSGEYAEAIEHLEAFRRARPEHPKAPGASTLIMRAWTNVGIDFVSRGQGDRAVHAFEQALAIDPANADLQKNLANALLDRRDFAGAERHAREALRLRPADPVAQEILAIATHRGDLRSP